MTTWLHVGSLTSPRDFCVLLYFSVNVKDDHVKPTAHAQSYQIPRVAPAIFKTREELKKMN